jgi:hypothetical protein
MAHSLFKNSSWRLGRGNVGLGRVTGGKEVEKRGEAREKGEETLEVG